MSDDMFGKRGDAAEILKKATKQVEGQQMSAENREKAAAAIAARAAEDDVQEAAAFTEEIIKLFNNEANDRDLTPEQRIFAISLATINLRQHFPDSLGGKEKFDAVAKTAWEYFDKNK